MESGGGSRINLNNHFLVFALGMVLAAGVSYFQDRSTSQTTVASNGIRIASLEDWRAEHQKVSVTREDLNRVEAGIRETQRTYVTKDEFTQFTTSMLRAVQELRDELRDRRR